MQTDRFYTLLENPDLLNAESMQELQELLKEYPYFQGAWMLYLKNLKKMESPDFEQVLKKVAVIVPDRRQLYRYLNAKTNMVFKLAEKHSEIPVYKLGDDSEVPAGDSLIDKFLSSNPGKIKQPLDDERPGEEQTRYEPEKNSLAENDEIITETLAMIYFQQKNYDKALDAFKKLSLKYPEKSVYFATRIEEIEHLKNIN